MRELREDEPVLGCALHPCPDVGHQGARGPDPVVEALQRSKQALHRNAHERAGWLPP